MTLADAGSTSTSTGIRLHEEGVLVTLPEDGSELIEISRLQ